MELNLEEQKQRFLDLCHSAIHRDGLDDLLDWLCKADFFEAPASTKFHGAYAGGLCQHSLDVYEYAKKLTFLSPTPISEEALVISTLFHDVCKCNLYKTEYRNQKINGEWQHVYQVQYFMKLEPIEAAAINCHMGFTDGSTTTLRDVSNAYQSNPLAWIVHVADEAATYLLDR